MEPRELVVPRALVVRVERMVQVVQAERTALRVQAVPRERMAQAEQVERTEVRELVE